MIELILVLVIITSVIYVIYTKSHIHSYTSNVLQSAPSQQFKTPQNVRSSPISSPMLQQQPSSQVPAFNYATRWYDGTPPPFVKIGFVYDKKKSGDMLDLFGRYLYGNKYEYYVVCPRTHIQIPIEGRSGKYIVSLI